MTTHALSQRLAVCSWSLQPTDPKDLVKKLKATGIARIQLALDPLRQTPAKWNPVIDLFKREKITILSGMFGCVGEDYSTLESIRLTGGIAPDKTWQENWRNIQSIAALAHSLGLTLLTFHAGFLPHRQTDKQFNQML